MSYLDQRVVFNFADARDQQWQEFSDPLAYINKVYDLTPWVPSEHGG